MNTAVVYTRFSPRPDAAESESCDTQEAQCLAHVEDRGWRVRSLHRDEGVSGKAVDRPGLAVAIGALKKGDVLLVVRRDRLARDAFLAELIRRQVAARGARIHALQGEAVASDDDSPEAAFVRHVLDGVAELERKLIGARTRTSMRTQQKAGKRVSYHAPFGWKVDPEDSTRLVRDEGECLHAYADSLGMLSRFKRVTGNTPLWIIHPGVWPDIGLFEASAGSGSATSS